MSTHPLSAGVASATETNSREKNGGSLMQQPLTILAWDYQSKLGVLTKASKSPLVRPNASIRSLGPASRVRGTAARGSFSPASRHRGIDQTGPSNLPGSTNANIPGSSPGNPGSFGHGTGQNAPGIPSSPGSVGPGTGQSAIGAGQIGSRAPGDGDRIPAGGLSAGQDVIEYLNRKDGIETPQNPTPQLFPPAASRQSCKINCIDAASSYGAGRHVLSLECQNGKWALATEVLLCNYICDGKVVQTGNKGAPNLWMICIGRDNCPKLEAKIQEVGPLGRPSVCSWYDKSNSNDRKMFDEIRCPQGTHWHEWSDSDRRSGSLEIYYAGMQEAGEVLPLLADFLLGNCAPNPPK